MATPARLDRLPAKESHGTALQESLRRYPMAVCVSVWHFGLTRSKNRALNSPVWNIYFKLVQGAVRAPEIVAFLKALRRHLGDRKLLIVWDRLQAHRSRLVREYVESQEGAIHLEFLPPYAPELNPVEYLWAHWKHHELANFCPKDFAELTVHARAKLRRTQRRKTLIAAFWKQAELPI